MFGVCYYPEHWPGDRWPDDARMMRELGLTYVRIGEFAWSRLEPDPGRYEFAWLDEAVEVLHAAGLSVVLGTPTATPPKWLIDKYPEILPVDPDTGRTRGFGSRRHYDFSSEVYRREALRITQAMAERYGDHPGVAGWQTDNELCCHDTALSGSVVARDAFREWCRERYGSVDALNEAWGNVFWSMEYRDFAEIELPVGAVTETSPAHRLAYRRFSSDRVVDFHDRMVDVIRQHAPGRFITHNFIPMAETGVDNFALAAPLDFASYDNYPLGRTDLRFADAAATEFRRYMRTGHPDYAAYCLDQTRCLTGKGFWIMEQQPGPVNWAASNPRPAPGMIRLWTIEAFAHGADCVAYFRWRQARFAQEQMHSGLLRPDNSKSAAWEEIEQAIGDIDILGAELAPVSASVALLSSPESLWLSDIERQSEFWQYDDIQFDYYSALRRLGVDVDFVTADSDLSSYRLIVAPSLPVVDDALVSSVQESSAVFVFGPRSGAKTTEFAYPEELPPGPLQKVLPIRVLSVETLRPDCPEPFRFEGKEYESTIWREELDAGDADVIATFDDGSPAAVRHANVVYLATLTDTGFLDDLLRSECQRLGIETMSAGTDVRISRRGNLLFACNYSNAAYPLPLPENADILLGSRTVAPRDVTVWKA